MSQLLVKYQQNQTAADKLINEHNLYAASVHCSYYSCIQLITHLLFFVAPGVDLTKLQEDLKEKESHKTLATAMRDELRSAKASFTEINEFDNLLKELKITRVRSDYKDAEIGKKDSTKAYDKSKKIIHILTTKFPIA